MTSNRLPIVPPMQEPPMNSGAFCKTWAWSWGPSGHDLSVRGLLLMG